jgi:hypothetical protein
VPLLSEIHAIVIRRYDERNNREKTGLLFFTVVSTDGISQPVVTKSRNGVNRRNYVAVQPTS